MSLRRGAFLVALLLALCAPCNGECTSDRCRAAKARAKEQAGGGRGARYDAAEAVDVRLTRGAGGGDAPASAGTTVPVAVDDVPGRGQAGAPPPPPLGAPPRAQAGAAPPPAPPPPVPPATAAAAARVPSAAARGAEVGSGGSEGGGVAPPGVHRGGGAAAAGHAAAPSREAVRVALALALAAAGVAVLRAVGARRARARDARGFPRRLAAALSSGDSSAAAAAAAEAIAEDRCGRCGLREGGGLTAARAPATELRHRSCRARYVPPRLASRSAGAGWARRRRRWPSWAASRLARVLVLPC